MKHFLIFSTLFLAINLTFTSCQNTTASQGNDDNPTHKASNNHLTMAVLYQQQAAEYRALCYQAFNIAKMRVDESTKMLGGMKKKAVIVDIDETMLDNSPYEAECVLDTIHYPNGWKDWIDLSSAKAVPGALEFVKYVESLGMEVYYISNRKEKYREQTLKNMKDLHFPYASDEYLWLKTDHSSKKERWEKAHEKANIILMIGDNLNDFSVAFEGKSIAERFAVTDSLKQDFGKRFIVLPNAMYGEWESALYNYDYSLNQQKRKEIRNQHLKGF